MAIPHAFKTVRHAGTPSAGGNIHTLESHIGSASAHPIYMKKGDKVGEMNLSDHESDINAHRQYYIRRLEMMTSLDEYQEYRKTDPTLYSGLDPSNLGTCYPIVVTGTLLSSLLEDDVALERYAPGVFLKKYIIEDTDQTKWPMFESDWKGKVPGWTLFYPLYRQVQTHEYDQKTGTERLLEDNPLARIFALKGHIHDGSDGGPAYALLNHTHTFDDVRNALGEKPASENHNHDDSYIKKEDLSSILGGETDLTPLREVGIYPYAVSADLTNETVNLNERVSQGCELYTIARNSQIVGFPTDVVSGLAKHFADNSDTSDIKSTDDGSRVNAIVQVMHGEGVPVNFENFTFSSYIGIPATDGGAAAATKNFIGATTSQILITMPGIQPYDREGNGLTNLVKSYHEELHDMYWRMGCCYESGWYIMRVLEDLLDITPKEFYEKVRESSTPVSTIYNLLETRMNADYQLSTTKRIPDGVVLGYFNPKPADFVHPARSRWLADIAKSTNDTSLYTKRTTMKANKVVAHDSVAWLVPETKLVGAPAGTLAHANDFANLRVIARGASFLDYATYYVNHVEFVLNSAWNTIPVGQKFYDDASESSLLTLKGGKVSWNTSLSAVEGTFISSTDKVLTEYHPITDGIFSGLRDYYMKNADPAVDQYGVPTFTKLTSPSGSISEYTRTTGKTVYQKVTITDKRGNLRWSKRPCKRNIWEGTTHYEGEAINTSKQYYTYDSATKEFTPISIGYGDSGLVPLINGAGPIFTDWDVYRRTSTKVRLARELFNITPILKSGIPFYKGVSYVAYPNYFQDTELTKNVTIVTPTIIETPEDLDSFYDYANHTFYTKNLTTGEVLAVADAPSKKDELLAFVANGVFTTDLRLCYTTSSTGTMLYYPEGFKYTFNESITSGSGVLRFGVKEATYLMSMDDPTNYLYTRAFAYPTVDMTVIPGKKYYTAVEYDVFNRVMSPSANPKTAGYYELIDTEALCDIWLAINQLITTGSDIAIGTNRVKYGFGDDGSLVAWKDWERVITPNDKVYKEFVDAIAAQKVIDPTFSVTKLITQSHAHSNKTLLDGLKVDDGALWYYNGSTYVRLTNNGESATFENKAVLEKIRSASAGTGMNSAANELWLELKTPEGGTTHKKMAFSKEVDDLRTYVEKALADIETGRSGSISVNIAEQELDTSKSTVKINGADYWKVEEVTNPADFLFSVHALVEDTATTKTFSYDIPNLMALVNYADGNGAYIPTVVSADSLLLIDRLNEVVYIRKPEQWLDTTDTPESTNHVMHIFVRRAKCSNMNGSYVWTVYSGEDASSSIIKKINATYGSVLEAFTPPSPLPSKSGYRFDGWSFNGAKYYEANGTTDKICLVVGNQSLFARFVAQLKVYTATSDSDSSSLLATLEGSDYTFLPTPTRSGYTFKGWQLNGGNSTLINGGTQIRIGSILGGKTLSAPGTASFTGKWDASGWTVALNHMGGTSLLNSISVSYNNAWPTIAEANLPTKDGYDFQGYYTASVSGTKIYNANGTPAVSKVDSMSYSQLYAQWTAMGGIQIELINTATNLQVGVLEATYDSALPDMTVDAPTRTGYTFGGWELDGTLWYGADGSKKLAKYTSTSSVTLASKWTANQYTMTLKDTPNNQTRAITATYDQNIPTTTPLSRIGYTFGGWYYKEAGKDDVQYYTDTGASAITKYLQTSNITLEDKWTANTYTLTLRNEGQIVGDPVTATYGQTLPQIDLDLEKTGFTLKGWYTASTGGTKVYNADGTGVAIWQTTSSITLYTQWEADGMSVTLNCGDDPDITPGTTEVAVTYGQEMPKITSLPTRNDGYILDGFYDAETGGTKYYNADGTSAKSWDKTESGTLYARWTKNKSIITWNDNGTTSQSMLPINQPFGAGMPSPTATGRTFYQWVDIDGNVYTWQTNVPSNDLTLYAKWKVDITFSTGIGSISDIRKTGLIVGSTFDMNFPDDLEYEGSIFRGWFTESTGGSKITYNSIVPNVNTTYYAQWLRDFTFGPSDSLSGNGVIRIKYGEVSGSPAATEVAVRFNKEWNVLPAASLPVEGQTVVSAGKASYSFPIWINPTILSTTQNNFYIGDSLQNTRSQTVAFTAANTLYEYSRKYTFTTSTKKWTANPAETTNPTKLQLHTSPYLEIRKKGLAFMLKDLKAPAVKTYPSWVSVKAGEFKEDKTEYDIGDFFITFPVQWWTKPEYAAGAANYSSNGKYWGSEYRNKTIGGTYVKKVSGKKLTLNQRNSLMILGSYSGSGGYGYANIKNSTTGTEPVHCSLALFSELTGIYPTSQVKSGVTVYYFEGYGYTYSDYMSFTLYHDYPKEVDPAQFRLTTDTTPVSGKAYYMKYTIPQGGTIPTEHVYYNSGVTDSAVDADYDQHVIWGTYWVKVTTAAQLQSMNGSSVTKTVNSFTKQSSSSGSTSSSNRISKAGMTSEGYYELNTTTYTKDNSCKVVAATGENATNSVNAFMVPDEWVDELAAPLNLTKHSMIYILPYYQNATKWCSKITVNDTPVVLKDPLTSTDTDQTTQHTTTDGGAAGKVCYIGLLYNGNTPCGGSNEEDSWYAFKVGQTAINTCYFYYTKIDNIRAKSVSIDGQVTT